MSIFAISDLHLSFGVNKPMDVFAGWEGYINKLRQNWENLITPEDFVVLPGDLSWGMNFEEALPDFQFIENLPGHKIVLKGNHDYWWNTMSKMNDFLTSNGLSTITFLNNNAFDAGNAVICGSRGWINDPNEPHNKKIIARESGRLNLSLTEGEKISAGRPILVFLHYPPVTQNSFCQEITDVLHQHGINNCYYGHIHGSTAQYAFKGVRDGIKYTILSCDALKFKPLKIL